LATLTWTYSFPDCGPLAYIYSTTLNYAADNTVFVIASGNLAKINTSDDTKVGTYSLKIRGTLPSGKYAEVFFTITIISCASTVVTTYNPGSITYTIGTPDPAPTFTAWTDSMGTCGPFTYTSTTNAFTTFTAASRLYSI
jgi:hypothetical protein